MGAKRKPTKTKKAFDDLAEMIGDDPPAELNRLSAADLTTLNRLVGESLDLHEATIAEAEENVVKLAPRPLRGTVRRLLGANR